MLARRRDAERILLEVTDVVERSNSHARLQAVLTGAGLSADEAHAVATMMLVCVVVAARRTTNQPTVEVGRPVLVAIDSGSRGVTLRAGAGFAGLIRVAHDPTSAAPAIERDDKVLVRRASSASCPGHTGSCRSTSPAA